MTPPRHACWLGLMVTLIGTGVLVLAAGPASPVYDRREWLPRWEDADGNCRDTRQEVLMRDHRTGMIANDQKESVALELTSDGCHVVSGRWLDVYAQTFVTEPSQLDIDHVGPLHWAHRRGGAGWPIETKRAYANWLGYRHALLAVSLRGNRQKGDRGPADWVPENVAYWCQYGTTFAVLVAVWDLHPTPAERTAIRKLVETC